MARNKTLPVIRRQLDERFEIARRALTPVPARGWIRAIRTALNMTNADFSRRLGTSPQAAWALERAETEGAITLKKLRDAAEALDCELRYVLIPRASLERTMQEQAERAARDHLSGISHTMALEKQDVSKEFEQSQIEELASELIDSSAIWKSAS